jgi:hypothetical protein
MLWFVFRNPPRVICSDVAVRALLLLASVQKERHLAAGLAHAQIDVYGKTVDALFSFLHIVVWFAPHQTPAPLFPGVQGRDGAGGVIGSCRLFQLIN